MNESKTQISQNQFLRLLKPILILPFNVMGTIPSLILWFSGRFETLNFEILSLALGCVLICIGLFIGTNTFFLLVKLGKGTPAPWDPPQNLVIVGIYKYVRNPMMIAVWFILIGESIVFHSFQIFLWFIVFLILCLTLIPLFEEPQLERSFGNVYRAYKNKVPRWIFRIK